MLGAMAAPHHPEKLKLEQFLHRLLLLPVLAVHAAQLPVACDPRVNPHGDLGASGGGTPQVAGQPAGTCMTRQRASGAPAHSSAAGNMGSPAAAG